MSLRLSAEAGGLPGAGRSRILTKGVLLLRGHCLNSGKHNTFLLEVRQSRGQTKTSDKRNVTNSQCLCGLRREEGCGESSRDSGAGTDLELLSSFLYLSS